MRGWSRLLGHRGVPGDLLPAHAGMAPGPGDYSPRNPDLSPRACGDGPWQPHDWTDYRACGDVVPGVFGAGVPSPVPGTSHPPRTLAPCHTSARAVRGPVRPGEPAPARWQDGALVDAFRAGRGGSAAGGALPVPLSGPLSVLLSVPRSVPLSGAHVSARSLHNRRSDPGSRSVSARTSPCSPGCPAVWWVGWLVVGWSRGRRAALRWPVSSGRRGAPGGTVGAAPLHLRLVVVVDPVDGDHPFRVMAPPRAANARRVPDRAVRRHGARPSSFWLG